MAFPIFRGGDPFSDEEDFGGIGSGVGPDDEDFGALGNAAVQPEEAEEDFVGLGAPPAAVPANQPHALATTAPAAGAVAVYRNEDSAKVHPFASILLGKDRMLGSLRSMFEGSGYSEGSFKEQVHAVGEATKNAIVNRSNATVNGLCDLCGVQRSDLGRRVRNSLEAGTPAGPARDPCFSPHISFVGEWEAGGETYIRNLHPVTILGPKWVAVLVGNWYPFQRQPWIPT